MTPASSRGTCIFKRQKHTGKHVQTHIYFLKEAQIQADGWPSVAFCALEFVCGSFGGPSIRSAMPTPATVLAATWSIVEPLDTPPKRDAFVRKLRLEKSLTGKKEFKKHIKDNYPSLNLSQIMQAFSKVVIADKQRLMMAVYEAEKKHHLARSASAFF